MEPIIESWHERCKKSFASYTLLLLLPYLDMLPPVPGFSKFNQIQLEKTAELALEVAKTMLLATVVGVLLPGVGDKIGLAGSLIGFVVFIASYVFAMWLLKGVKH